MNFGQNMLASTSFPSFTIAACHLIVPIFASFPSFAIAACHIVPILYFVSFPHNRCLSPYRANFCFVPFPHNSYLSPYRANFLLRSFPSESLLVTLSCQFFTSFSSFTITACHLIVPIFYFVLFPYNRHLSPYHANLYFVAFLHNRCLSPYRANLQSRSSAADVTNVNGNQYFAAMWLKRNANQ
jgi:hypothetical protein